GRGQWTVCSTGWTRSTATATSSGAGSGRAARSSPQESSGGATTTATYTAAGASHGTLIRITDIRSAAATTLTAKASDADLRRSYNRLTPTVLGSSSASAASRPKSLPSDVRD